MGNILLMYHFSILHFLTISPIFFHFPLILFSRAQIYEKGLTDK